MIVSNVTCLLLFNCVFLKHKQVLKYINNFVISFFQLEFKICLIRAKYHSKYVIFAIFCSSIKFFNATRKIFIPLASNVIKIWQGSFNKMLMLLLLHDWRLKMFRLTVIPNFHEEAKYQIYKTASTF